ncbi:MAG: hypothetical protein JXA15_00680 [Spirochaetales bacterium]|nr:hypothetical protein [Spirochaetales bacterium]
MRKTAIAAFALVALAASVHAQFLVSARGVGYLGQDGLMPGGGIGFESAWRSFFSESTGRVSVLSIGFEFLSVPSAGGLEPGGGFVMPFEVKERFLIDERSAWVLGGGGALVMLDAEAIDEWGYQYTDYTTGGAVYAQGGRLWLVAPQVSFGLEARAGALFAEGGPYPFLGVIAGIGLIF